MLKRSLFYLLLFFSQLHADDIIGFWKTIDDKTGKAESIIGIYEHEGKFFGRIISTFNDDGSFNDTMEAPKERAPGVEGHPFYSGMDIIWNLKKEGDKFTHGKILDPEKGRIYNAVLWNQAGKLMVRGEVWIFGKNQEWIAAKDSDFPPNFKKPDLTKFVPVIPKVKKKESQKIDSSEKTQ